MKSILYFLLAHILFSFTFHRLSSWLHLAHARERLLQKLEPWRFHRPTNALSEREMLNHNVIKSVDSVVSEQAKERIMKGVVEYGLITRQRDYILNTPLTFEWKRFFTRSTYLLQELVLPVLVDFYKDQNITCFVILPFPRYKMSRPTVDFEQSLENLLGSRKIYKELFTPAIVDKKVGTTWLSQLRKGEKILVIQPMALHDDYLNKAIQYISDHSLGSIFEILTIIDGSGRPPEKRIKSPFERVLIELKLSE